VSPAGSGRPTSLLARSHSRRVPQPPPAARVANECEPLNAVRRSARSLSTARAVRRAPGPAIVHAPIHWSTSRRALRGPRSFRAVPGPH